MRILNNKFIKIMLIAIIAVLSNTAIIEFLKFDFSGKLTLEYTVKGEESERYQLFYSNTENWSEEDSICIDYIEPYKKQQLVYILPKQTEKVRVDLGNKPGDVLLSNISINYLWKEIDVSNKILTQNIDSNTTKDIKDIKAERDGIKIERSGGDAFIVLDLTDLKLSELLKADTYISCFLRILICIVVDVLLFIFIKKRSVIKIMGNELYKSKTLIWNLAKNDFKTKYAGSYLGIIWAFIQPIVTVLVYWFVFEVGFRSSPIEDFPFVLWLIAGIVPWFFFSDAIMNATNSMIEYSYLVKKVVFKVSILPIVKIISALFVHIFFICFTVLIFALNGYMPNIYMIQVIYYTVCMFAFILGISYATCAIVIFFKDLGQIIMILLQIGMWITPIMWSDNMIEEGYRWILEINPMYYIIQGYRDAFINNKWFWENINITIYFWILTISLFGIGVIVFKRLKVHFADVL